MTPVAVVESATLVASALVVARVVDAATGFPRPVLRASAPSPHTRAHIADGSFLVLVGRPELALPGLATTDRGLDARLELDDAASIDIAFTLPAGTLLPYRSTDVSVESPAVALTGSVRAASFPHGPIAGADIDVGQTTATGVLTGLRIPLAAAHPAGATVSERPTTVAAPATVLSAPAVAGQRGVVVENVAGCSGPNAVLMLGQPSTAEHAVISAVDVAARRLTLGGPLRRSRPAGSVVQAHTLGNAGQVATLTRAVFPGDGVVALSVGLPPGVVELTGPVPELRATGVASDAGGRWRLDGVRGVRRLTLVATAPAFDPATIVYDIDYRRPNVIDLDLTT